MPNLCSLSSIDILRVLSELALSLQLLSIDWGIESSCVIHKGTSVEDTVLWARLRHRNEGQARHAD